MTPTDPPLRIRVSAHVGAHDLIRLCPGGGTVDGCTFDLNPAGRTACDFWVVYSGAAPREVADVDPRHTLFLTGEPPEKKIYPRRYYAQFHRVKSYHPDDPHPRVSWAGGGLNWWVGMTYPENRYVLGHAELSAMPWPEKQDRVSVVCSTDAFTPGQRARLAFMARLKERLGDRLVQFGRGFEPIGDKLDVIAPYAYHLVLENCRHPHYWSEKLSDAYLGRAYPFYLGAPNLSEYFPAEAFTPVDPDQPEAAIAAIEAALAENRASASREVIDVCRDRVLNDYNLFTQIARWARAYQVADPTPRAVTVRSQKAFRPFPRDLLFRLKTRTR